MSHSSPKSSISQERLALPSITASKLAEAAMVNAKKKLPGWVTSKDIRYGRHLIDNESKLGSPTKKPSLIKQSLVEALDQTKSVWVTKDGRLKMGGFGTPLKFEI